MKEIWRDIPGYEGKYQASNLGRIKSLNYKGKKGIEKLLCPYLVKENGYYQVRLNSKPFCVHVLIGKTFPEICGKWFEGCVYNHLNENKKDNRAENLRSCTFRENVMYSHSKPVNQYSNGILIKHWESAKDVEIQLGYSHWLISAVCRHLKSRKTAYGYQWEFAEEHRD